MSLVHTFCGANLRPWWTPAVKEADFRDAMEKEARELLYFIHVAGWWKELFGELQKQTDVSTVRRTQVKPYPAPW